MYKKKTVALILHCIHSSMHQIISFVREKNKSLMFIRLVYLLDAQIYLWLLQLNANRNNPLNFLYIYTLILVSSSVQPPARSVFSSPDAQGPSLGSCQPHTHIMFLKTHKTASSTVLNMLYRFGEERDLHFALPLGYQLGYPLTFNAHRVKGYKGPRVVEFHIMGNHMRFHKTEVSVRGNIFSQ